MSPEAKIWIIANRSVLSCVALLAVVLIAGWSIVDGFMSVGNFKSMLLLAAFLGLASLGQTFCALLGGIDLSISFIIGSANVFLPFLFNSGVPPVVAVSLVFGAGLVFGALNGFLSYRIQGQSLIVTLGMGFAIVGATQIVTSIGSAYAGNVVADVPDWLSNFASMGGTTFGLGIAPVIVFWGLLALAVILVMHRTWFGRSVYALGGSRTAASLIPISEFRTWVSAYAISGATAAVTGMVLLGFSGGGFAGVGDQYLFMTVAAVVFGGTSLLGGEGGYGATMVGVLTLTALSSVLVGLGLSYAAQQAVFGLLIVPMVALYARSPPIRMQI